MARKHKFDFISAEAEFRAVIDGAQSTDRVVALVALSYLERALGSLLESFFVTDRDNILNRVIDGASLSARINLAYACGLLKLDVRRMLDILRGIRNEFAHGVDIELEFNSTEKIGEELSIKERCSLLAIEQQYLIPMEDATAARSLFVGAASQCWAEIRAAIYDIGEKGDKRKRRTDAWPLGVQLFDGATERAAKALASNPPDGVNASNTTEVGGWLRRELSKKLEKELWTGADIRGLSVDLDDRLTVKIGGKRWVPRVDDVQPISPGMGAKKR